MAEEWGPWVEHDMLGIKPYGAGYVVHMEYGLPDGTVKKSSINISSYPAGRSNGWHRDDYPDYLVVIRYRIRKPKGLTILEALLQPMPDLVDA